MQLRQQSTVLQHGKLVAVEQLQGANQCSGVQLCSIKAALSRHSRQKSGGWPTSTAARASVCMLAADVDKLLYQQVQAEPGAGVARPGAATGNPVRYPFWVGMCVWCVWGGSCWARGVCMHSRAWYVALYTRRFQSLCDTHGIVRGW
jgi:hypothetical protein